MGILNIFLTASGNGESYKVEGWESSHSGEVLSDNVDDLVEFIKSVFAGNSNKPVDFFMGFHGTICSENLLEGRAGCGGSYFFHVGHKSSMEQSLGKLVSGTKIKIDGEIEVRKSGFA